MAVCGSCAANLDEGARFCSECGAAQVTPSCAVCGETLHGAAKFCSHCGAATGRGAGPAGSATLSSGAGASVARRVTSVLFGDLVGFTALSAGRDHEDVRDLQMRYFEECRTVVGRYGGVVEKFIGDALMAVWGVPTAHEDDAERAVRAGLELVAAVAALRDEVGVDDLGMRVGIVTGEVAVTVGATGQGMVAGDAVNTASRVQSAAAPGQVWVDETTRLLSSAAITYTDVGSHVMKGKADPVPLWAVHAVVAAVGGNQRADGLEAPHVGRDREMRVVKEIFHGVQETRRPALLVVGGEAGVGKSRLAWEFEKYVDGLRDGVRWHSGRCLAYGEGVAFYALSEVVRARLEVLTGDVTKPPAPGEVGAAAAGVLIEDGLRALDLDATEQEWLTPRLAALLGTGSVTTFPREDLFAAWTTFLQRVSGDGVPVTVVIDDAHHADDGLVAFLEHLMTVGSVPCLVVLLARPGLLEAHPGLPANPRCTVLHLEPLDAPQMGALLDGLVASVPGSVRESLVVRAEGIPLFAVETVRSLIDRDLVVPRGGQYVLADPGNLNLDTLAAPASLQALVASRLDMLTPEQRQVVDRASLVGATFSRAVIAELCPGVADLDAVLAQLVRLQIFRREENRLSAERGQLQFVQTVVRQVAYGILARRDRRAGHLAVVQAISSTEKSDELAAVVAQHYLEALAAVPDAPDAIDLAALAVEQLRRAARRAESLGAFAEAAGHLEAALARVPEDRDDRRVLERDLARCLFQCGRYVEGEEHAQAALDACEAAGDAVGAGSAAFLLGRSRSLRGGNVAGVELLQAHYEALRHRPDARAVRLDLAAAMLPALWRQGLDAADLLLEHAVLADQSGDPQAQADSFSMLGLFYMGRGTPGVARTMLGASADLARANHDPVRLARTLINLAADWNSDDVARARGLATEATAVAARAGVTYWINAAEVNLLIGSLYEGSWPTIAEVLDQRPDADPYPETPSVALVVWGVVALARHGLVEDAAEPVETTTDDTAAMAWARMLESIRCTSLGRPQQAVAAALAAVDLSYRFGGLGDDFFVTWGVAARAALDAEDDEALDRICGMVDSSPQRLRRATAADRAWVEAHRSVRAGRPSAVVEAQFRAALDAYEQWGSRPWAARCRADLGVWLTREGRVEEAAPLLAEARTVYADLGAAAWSEALDDALAWAARP